MSGDTGRSPGSGTEVAATRSGYDAVAADYAREIAGELAGKPLDRALLDAVAELAAGAVVADIGCGPGHVAAYLAARGARVVGLDLSPAMCRIGRRATSLPFATADMTALPVTSGRLAAVVSLYAVIHLDRTARAMAYREFARSLQPGGHALVAFHTSDADVRPGGQSVLTQWWNQPVSLTFRYLDPVTEIDTMAAAGLALRARLDREPHAGGEHQSRRCYLLVQRS